MPTLKFQQVTVSDTPIQLPGISDNGRNEAQYASITVEGDPVRVRLDGTDPSSTIGHLMYHLFLDDRKDIKEFRAVRSGTSDSVMSISYLNVRLSG